MNKNEETVEFANCESEERNSDNYYIDGEWRIYPDEHIAINDFTGEVCMIV